MTPSLLMVVLVSAMGGVLVAPPAAGSTPEAVPLADDGKAKKAKKAKADSAAGTATITIDGTTWEAKADKGKCTIDRKVAKGIKLRAPSFDGLAGDVRVTIAVNPAASSGNASVRAVTGNDPWWDSTGARAGAITVKGRTTSGTISFVSPIKDAEAIAARQDPRSYEGTFSFTC